MHLGLRGRIARIVIRTAVAVSLTAASISVLFRPDFEPWYFGWWPSIAVVASAVTAEWLARKGELTNTRIAYFAIAALLTLLSYGIENGWAMHSSLAVLAGGMASIMVRNRPEHTAFVPEKEDPPIAGGTDWPITTLSATVVGGAAIWMGVVLYGVIGESDGESAAWALALGGAPVKSFGIPALVIWVSAAQSRSSPWKWGILPAVLMLGATAICFGHVVPWF